MPSKTDEIVSFGPFSLSRSRRILLDGEKPLRLGGRALDMLIALVDDAGEVVSKEALISRVWPKTVVEETSLRVHIGALRKVLGDGHGGARYIANIPGRGYAFVAPVTTMQPQVHVPAALAARPEHNLPVRLTRMIGRSHAVESLRAQLEQRRFVSIVGPGGMGKTTLALAVAEEVLGTYAHGVRFVDLSVLADSDLVASALATSLGVSLDPQDPAASLAAHVRNKQMLILLDNCEQVALGASHLAVILLKAAPGLRVLATSREPLRAEGESVHRLTALEAPSASAAPLTAARAMSFPAVQLLVERVTESLDAFVLTDADADVAAELCRRLDGMPLAIELAAVRVGFFGLRDLVARLGDRLHVLTSGRRTMLPRHRTLRALLDWSHDLLSEKNQIVLRRLSVFAGSFTLEAAAAVATASPIHPEDVLDEVAELAAKSLIATDLGGHEVRYRLLESTRAYAAEKLAASDERAETLRRQATHLLGVLDCAAHDWAGTARTQWLENYGWMIDDVRFVLDWALGTDGDVTLGVRLTVAAVPLAHRLSLLDEYRARVERALVKFEAMQPRQPLLEIQLNTTLGGLLGQSKGAVGAARAARGKVLGLAETPGSDPYRAEMLYGLWAGSYGDGDYPTALRHANALHRFAKAAGEPMTERVSNRMLAQTHHFMGDHARARILARGVLDDPGSMDRLGGSPMIQVNRQVSMRIVLARVLWIEGFADQASRMAAESLAYEPYDLAYGHCQALALAACPIALWRGDHEAAHLLVNQLLDYSTRYALGYWQAWARHFEMVLTSKAGIDIPATDAKQWDMFGTLGPQHVGARAVARVEAATVGWCAPEVLRGEGEILLRESTASARKRAEVLFRKSLKLACTQQALSWELRSAMSLARLWHAAGRVSDARELLASTYARFTEGFETADLVAARALLEELGAVALPARLNKN